MKKVIVKAISAVLVVALSIFAFSSCFNFGEHYQKNIFPDGYTGGFGIEPGSSVEYYWVETYEEARKAVELLKSHGSIFANDVMFSYEGDLFDTKYCFTFGGRYKHEKDRVEYGDNPYDRWANDVTVQSFAFFEDVTIDDLIYSLTKHYDAYIFTVNDVYIALRDNITPENLQFDDWVVKNERYYRYINYEEESIIQIISCFFGEREIKMTDECIEAIIGSGEFIELN